MGSLLGSQLKTLLMMNGLDPYVVDRAKKMRCLLQGGIAMNSMILLKNQATKALKLLKGDILNLTMTLTLRPAYHTVGDMVPSPVSPDQSGYSSIVHKIPHFVVDQDEDTTVSKRNRLKALLEKMTKEELTPEFLSDLVSMSRLTPYLALI